MITTMTKRQSQSELKKKFWNQRAGLGHLAGTDDFHVADLEMTKLLGLIKRGSTVFEAGAGNGILLTQLITRNKCTGLGMDFAVDMVNESNKLAQKLKCAKKASFIQGELLDVPKNIGLFDYAISKRALCNLTNNEEHYQAFQQIMDRVKPGGFYLMLEDFQEPLARLNAVRKSLGLYPIKAPWHNVFLNEKSVLGWQDRRYQVERIEPFISTYYFLSRVLYARLAADRGEALRYDSDINNLAVKLPPMGDYCPTKLIIWKKSNKQ